MHNIATQRFVIVWILKGDEASNNEIYVSMILAQ